MQGTRTRDERDGDPQATEVLGMRSRLATYMYIHTVHIHIHAHNSEMGSCSTHAYNNVEGSKVSLVVQ